MAVVVGLYDAAAVAGCAALAVWVAFVETRRPAPAQWVFRLGLCALAAGGALEAFRALTDGWPA